MEYSLSNYLKEPLEFQDVLFSLFNKEDKLIIFDIGACEAEDSIRYSMIFPNSQIYSFEPLPKNIERAKENIVKYNRLNIKLYSKALSDKNGISKFHVSSGSPEQESSINWDFGNKSSSLLAPDKVQEEFRWLKFNEVINVSTDTLKNFCTKNNIVSIDFMHLDVQGAELLVLEGAGDYLKNIKSLWLEVENISLYSGQPLKKEVETFMNYHGFTKVLDHLTSISGDQFYVRNDFLPESKTQKKEDKNIVFNFFKELLPRNKFQKISYSQTGEDLIVDFIFNQIGIKRPSYIDIGAHHPEYLNNTALFYKNGSRGINIEPDPNLFKEFIKYRKQDINLNLGISNTAAEMDFFIMNVPTLNTFSSEEALKYQQEGNYKVKEIKKINVETISNILSKYYNNAFPDFLTIDAEGIDEIVLKSIDYNSNYPIVICTETISFSDSGKGKKNTEIINFLESKGYLLYADTYINSIFVRKENWLKKNNELNAFT